MFTPVYPGEEAMAEAVRKRETLTVEEVRKLKPATNRQEIKEKGGLYLVIQPSGVKSAQR